MASIRSKHNNLLNYFICNHKDLSKAYVRKCEKFLTRNKRAGGILPALKREKKKRVGPAHKHAPQATSQQATSQQATSQQAVFHVEKKNKGGSRPHAPLCPLTATLWSLTVDIGYCRTLNFL